MDESRQAPAVVHRFRPIPREELNLLVWIHEIEGDRLLAAGLPIVLQREFLGHARALERAAAAVELLDGRMVNTLRENVHCESAGKGASTALACDESDGVG